MRKYFFTFIFLFCLTFVPSVFADTPAVTGFVPGQIWYSKEPLVEGETVKIYTAIWNGDTDPISTHVEFYDKSVLLGSRDIAVASAQISDVSISWKVTAGEHTISAKITSSSSTVSGKKQNITLDHITTTEDHTFVPVSVKTVDGVSASSSDVIKTQVDKIASSIDSFIPKTIGGPVASTFNSLDSFRDMNYNQIVVSKNETQKRLDVWNGTAAPAQVKPGTLNTQKSISATQPPSGADKPIAYVKVFFLSVLAFIFGHKLVFYGLIAFLVFILIRFIYRKIRNR